MTEGVATNQSDEKPIWKGTSEAKLLGFYAVKAAFTKIWETKKCWVGFENLNLAMDIQIL